MTEQERINRRKVLLDAFNAFVDTAAENIFTGVATIDGESLVLAMEEAVYKDEHGVEAEA